MSFLHPALLALLPLAVVPIILHLITLHRLKTTELSTFRFLFESYQRHQSRLKFMEALLTALRTLFLLLLVLAVCRPVARHWSAWLGGHGREKIVLVDCSASMNARTDGVSALERAKLAVLGLVDRLGRDERLTLVRVTGSPEEVISRFSADNAAIRARVEALETGPAVANFFAALKRVYETRGRREAAPSVYVVTDAQAGNWERGPQGLDQIVPAGARLMVVNVGSRQPLPNAAVIGDPPLRQRAVAGLPVVLEPRLANYSRETPAELTVKAVVNELEVARATVTLKPGEVRTVELPFVPKEVGTWRGRFEISPDRFPDDDTYLFTLTVVPQIPVLLVNGNPNPDPYLDEALYLRTALTATIGDEAGSLRPGGARSDWLRPVAVRELPESQVNPETLRGISVVVLANCGGLQGPQFEWLRKFVADGGGALVFPGDHVTPALYNQQLFPAPGPQRQSLTGVSLQPPAGDPEQAATFERLAAIDFDHPVLSVFKDAAAKYLATARFYRWFPLAPAAGAAKPWALMRFSTGEPALVENRFGDGVVLVAAFPAQVRWTNLPLKPEFVPLLLRMVNYAQRRPEMEAPAVASAGGAEEIGVAKDWAPVTGTVTDPAGRVTPLAFQRTDERWVAAFEQGNAKGYYQVEVAGGDSAQRQRATTMFAMNIAPAESDFRGLSETQLQRLMPQAKVRLVDATAEAQQLATAIGDEREAWRFFIWLLFAIMGAEFTIATLSGRPRVRRSAGDLASRLEPWIPAGWTEWVLRIGGRMGATRDLRGGSGNA